MDFFQRVGNFFQGKGWISDEEKRRKEQQVQAQPQNKPAVTFKQDPVLNNLNKAPSFGSPSPTQGLFQQKPQTDTVPKTDTAPKVNTVPTANQFTKPVVPEIKPEIPQKTINDAPKVLTPQGQQDWVNKENKQIQNQNLANKPMITPKNPTYFDYLNPFGEHGLFGAKQQQNFKQTVEKPITDNINKFNNWIDSSDKEKGFQWSDPGDYLRFAAKIPGGMVQGLAETPNKVANAVTGIEADENGKVKQLNGVQRFGKGLDAGISVGGLGFGGSGTLLRSLAGLGKAGTKQAVKQGIGRTVLNGTKNLVKDSLKEGAEEVTQTFAQDLADDGKINTDKNVYFQSGAFGALGGGMMHGAGRAVDGVKGMVRNRINPYKVNNSEANQPSPEQARYNAATKLAALEREAGRQMSFDKNNAKLPLQDAEFNTGAVERLAQGLKYGTDKDISFLRMRPELLDQANVIRKTRGLNPYKDNTVTAYKNAVNNHLNKRVNEGMSPERAAYMAADSLISPESQAYGGTTSRSGYNRDHINIVASPGETGRYNTATIADFNGNISLKNISPRREGEIKNLSQQREEISRASDGGANVVPSSTNSDSYVGGAPVSAGRSSDGANIAQEAQNVNEDVKYKLNPEHEAQVRAYNEHITRLRQREEYLRGQGMSENAPAMINLRKAQEQAIDEFIYENIDPKLFLENSTGVHGNEGGDWNIPRLHVDDLQHHLGKELARDLPSNYKRRTGRRDIDTKAMEMGYDDVDTFIDEIKRVAEARRAERERKALLAEWRRDPDVIEEAQKMLAERHAEETPKPPTNAERVSSIDPADINTNDYVNDLVKEQKLARKGEQPTLRERWQDFKADMREKFVDRFAPIEDKIKNQSEQLEMRNAIDRTLRADGISEAFIRDNNFDKLITGFKNKKELQTFEQALIAKHALELESNGVETGRDIAKDKALVKATDKRFAKEFKQVREYSDKVLQQTVDYGLISQDTANYLRKKYPDYIPFDRIFSDKEINTQMKHGVGVGEASLSTQSIIQRIEGSSRSIDSPLNALITKTQDMVRQGERNKTAELLASYAKDPKNPFQLRELKPDETADGRPTISYLDNGKKRTFLAAPEVARAAKNMNREQMGIILRALATPARLLRMGATTVNAGFTMANVVKDFVGATINSKGGLNSMNSKSIVSALGAAFHHNGDLYAEMQREGVLGNIYELTRNASDLNLNEIRSHKNILTRSLHNAKSPLKTLENTIGRSEDFGRALQYVANKKYAKRKGMSESEAIKFAADQARWNSTNFLRSGTYGKAINAIVPYSNANIQGQRITLRRMKENPARYTGKIALGIVAPTIAAMAWNYADEERKKVMENIPEYVKENNVVVVSPNAKYNKEQNKWEGVYLVPVPPQFSPLHRQLHNMVKSTMTGQQFDVDKTVGDAVEQVTTVNPMEIRRTGAQYVPQAVKPFMETWANKNLYTGQEVVPEGMKNLDGKDQWDNSTSLTARKVGELTGLSPKQIDNAFRTSTAGGGQNLLHGMDFAIAKATGASDDEIKGRSMLDSVVGRFYAPKGTSQSSYFYQSLEKAAKDNKLSGSDLELYQALTSRKYNGDGSVEGKTEGDVLMNNRILANKPNIVKALSEAAKWRSAQTGEELDPLYKLPVDKQQYFYHLQGSPKNGAEQRKLKQDAPWLEDFQKERSAYFKRQDFKSGKSNRVPYPEVSDELQATLKTYHDMPSSPQKWAFLDAHPELSDHYKQIEDYNNKVREAQGYAPLRTRPQQSQYVKMQMANKNWRDPAVAKYLQDLNVYNITNSASLAEMQGEELSPKALKAIQSVGKYGLVKNPDGTFALKYPDGQGTNESHIQQGAVDMSSFGRRRGGRGSSSNGIKTSTDTLKLSNATALGMNAFKKNKGGLPQFSVKAIQKSGLLKSRRPTSRVVTFR
nr:MAG TPA: Large polyvalent protein associated domain 38 [Caudoviricetes sp.]